MVVAGVCGGCGSGERCSHGDGDGDDDGAGGGSAPLILVVRQRGLHDNGPL